MKIAYLMGTLNPGGAETLILSVLQNSVSHALNAICIYRHSGLLYEKYKETGVEMLHFPLGGCWDVFALFRLRRLLAEENIDIIHVHQRGDAILALMATVFSHVKVVFTIHGFIYPRHKVFDLEMFVIRHVEKIIFVSGYQRRFYINNYHLPDKIVSKSCVLYNGIDMARFHNNRQDDGRTLSKLVLGTVGSFVSVRNQMLICKFLNELNKAGVDFVFSFIGAKAKAETYLFDNCVKYCEEHSLLGKVHFLGARNDVPELLNDMDAFIYATVEDTFGIAVVEAIASGVPVFVNDWGVMKEISGEGKYAIIYQSENVEDLMSRFTDFCVNIELYKEKASNNAVEVKHIYDIHTHIDNLLKIYNTVN